MEAGGAGGGGGEDGSAGARVLLKQSEINNHENLQYITIDHPHNHKLALNPKI